MILFNIMEIVGRILCGLIAVGFIVGICLSKKHRVFENIFVGASFIVLVYGVTRMIVFSILGI